MKQIEAPDPDRQRALVSGLAEGADRLAAHAAEAQGWTLIAMLPFSRVRYLEDFTGAASRAEFNALLAHAQIREFPAADRYTDPEQPYAELASRLIAEADALIAIWDGQPAQGRGGTLEVIEKARAKAIPVWWLHALENRPPALI